MDRLPKEDRLLTKAWNATVWQGGEVLETFPTANLEILLWDFSGTMVEDTSMPLEPPDISPLGVRGLILNLDYANQTASFLLHSLYVVE